MKKLIILSAFVTPVFKFSSISNKKIVSSFPDLLTLFLLFKPNLEIVKTICKILDDKMPSNKLSSYSELKPVIEPVENDLDFLEKNLEIISPKINLLVDRYSPRIQWKKFLFDWRYALASLSLVFFLYFTQLTAKNAVYVKCFLQQLITLNLIYSNLI